MSYEGTICPCGDKKESNTMLCNGCVSTFEQHPSCLLTWTRAKILKIGGTRP